MPQSMQRAPWAFSSGSASGSWYSTKSCTRSGIGRFGPLTRWIFRKPPISPIARQYLLRGLFLDLLLLGGGLAAAARVTLGPLRRDGRVLVLARLAEARGLMVTVPGGVRRDLARLDWARTVAIAALADHRGLAGLRGRPLGFLAERTLVVDRHDLHPGAAELVPALQHAGGHGGAGALRVLLDERAHCLEVVAVSRLEL